MIELNLTEVILSGYSLISTCFNVWITAKYYKAKNGKSQADNGNTKKN